MFAENAPTSEHTDPHPGKNSRQPLAGNQNTSNLCISSDKVIAEHYRSSDSPNMDFNGSNNNRTTGLVKSCSGSPTISDSLSNNISSDTADDTDCDSDSNKLPPTPNAHRD